MNKITLGIFFTVIALSEWGCAPAPSKALLKQYPLHDEQIIITSTKSKSDLYAAVRPIIVDMIANKKNVDYDDKELGIISFQNDRLLKLPGLWGTKNDGKLSYWAKIEFKDNKVRITLNNFKGFWWKPDEGVWVEPSNLLERNAAPTIDTYRKEFYDVIDAEKKDYEMRIRASISKAKEDW